MQLLNLGMTREEFCARDVKLREQAALEDELTATAATEVALVPSGGFFGERSPVIQQDTPLRPRRVELTDEALDRIESAIERAPTQPLAEPVKPPWEVLAVEDSK